MLRLTVLEAHDVRRRVERDRQNLFEIKRGLGTYRKYCTLDNSAPQVLKTARKRLRTANKQQVDALRQREIHHENLRIMQRMTSIMRRSDGNESIQATSKRLVKSRAIARAVRAKEREFNSAAIKAENRLLRERLMKTQPVYSARKWQNESKVNAQYVRQLSFYESARKPTRPKFSGPSAAGRNCAPHRLKNVTGQIKADANESKCQHQEKELTQSNESFDDVAVDGEHLKEAPALGVQPESGVSNPEDYASPQPLECRSLDAIVFDSESKAENTTLAKDILSALRNNNGMKAMYRKPQRHRPVRGRSPQRKSDKKAKRSTSPTPADARKTDAAVLPSRMVYKRATVLNGRHTLVRLVWLGGIRRELEAFVFEIATQKKESYVLSCAEVKQIAQFYARSQAKGKMQAILQFCLDELEQSPESVNCAVRGNGNAQLQHTLSVCLRGPITKTTIKKMAADPAFAAQMKAKIPRVEFKPLHRATVIERDMEYIACDTAWRPADRFAKRTIAALKPVVIANTEPTHARVKWTDERIELSLVFGGNIQTIDLGYTLAVDPTSQEREMDIIVRCIRFLCANQA